MPPKSKLPPKGRKFESGHEKRMKKKRRDALTQSQSGALEKFIIREPQNIDVEIADNDDVQPIDVENVDNVDVENVDDGNENVDGDDNENVDVDDNEIVPTVSVDVNDIGHDIFDPSIWDSLDSKMRDLLVIKGPKRDRSIVKGPKDKFSRRFTANWYTRVLPNGETCDRDWLVYSKDLDRIFCFCCKVFKRGIGIGQLVNEGFSDWTHIGQRLKEHETGMEHVKN
jgi:hypothetical protein